MSNISRHKKRNRHRKPVRIQPYIVGTLMILLIFALAFLLIYASNGKVQLANINLSGGKETLTESLPQSSEAEIYLDFDDAEIMEPSETTSKMPPVDKPTAEFTSDEIKQINALIKKYETIKVPLSSLSSQPLIDAENASSKPEKTSSEEMVEVKSNVSIYYEDIASGYIYQNNGDYKYFIASLIKAPYAMFLYELAEQGKCNLNEVFTIEFEDIQKGTGKIKDMKEEEFPLKMTARELISYCIRCSDNTAMETLRKKYTDKEYLPYAKSLGLNYPQDVRQIVNGKITAKDCGIYIKAIYNYIENGKYGSELKEDMLNTSNALIRSKYPIARKYGWADLSFHDMAVVYAPSPYLLVILTDKDMGYKSDYAFMAELSKLIGSFHQKRYK